ncbi:hypothetical protein ACPPVT_06570 [Angustibacter sp. McL0619]|uniref:hypothetical protein n=1 Tax=Angustibacter sp. McL0619 TaxID=3415676 RepID=UPI003CED8726
MTSVRVRTFSVANAVAVMNGVANRFLIPLLHSSAGERLGRRFAVVEYLGRRTGQPHQLVALYVAEGRTVRIEVGMAESKTWWRNFEEPHPIRLRLEGADHDGVAHVVHDGDRVRVMTELDRVHETHTSRHPLRLRP